jgi:hypothetical protein
MSLFRLLRQSVSRFPLRPTVAGLAVFVAGLLAAGTFSSALPAAPKDTCLPIVGCVTTTVPTITVPTVTLPTLPTSTTTTTTTTPDGGGSTTGSGGGSNGSTTPAGTTTTTTTSTDSAETPGAALSVRISVRVLGHGAKRAIELRLRLSKPARVSALLSRKGKALKRKQFSARAGSSVWRLRLGRTVKPGAAKLGLTYRSTSGEIARSNHQLRLPR